MIELDLIRSQCLTQKRGEVLHYTVLKATRVALRPFSAYRKTVRATVIPDTDDNHILVLLESLRGMIDVGVVVGSFAPDGRRHTLRRVTCDGLVPTATRGLQGVTPLRGRTIAIPAVAAIAFDV